MSNYFKMILVLIIFCIIELVITMSIQISNIKKNWDHYKCNPLIMPFAGVFGKDPVENGKQCLHDVQMDFMSAFLDPLYFAINNIVNIGGDFGKLFDGVKEIAGLNQLLSMNVLNDLTGRITNTINGMGNVMDNTTDGLNEVFSIFGSLQTSTDLGISSVEAGKIELPGKMWGAIQKFI